MKHKCGDFCDKKKCDEEEKLNEKNKSMKKKINDTIYCDKETNCDKEI